MVGSVARERKKHTSNHPLLPSRPLLLSPTQPKTPPPPLYIRQHPPFSAVSGSGFRSFSISATAASKILPTLSLWRADASVKKVLPHDAARAAPSSRVTCLVKKRGGNTLVRVLARSKMRESQCRRDGEWMNEFLATS